MTVAAGAAWMLGILLCVVGGVTALVRAPATASLVAQPLAGPSALARRDIPDGYLRLYMEAAARYGLDWALLAAIGKVECDHGRDPDPSCRVEGRTNSAGAGGPMQFLASTWAAFGVDGDGDGRADRWDPADAVLSAANYLRASGAARDERRAILAYNHAVWYVDLVLRWAARYRAASPARDGPAGPSSGESTIGGTVRRPLHSRRTRPAGAGRSAARVGADGGAGCRAGDGCGWQRAPAPAVRRRRSPRSTWRHRRGLSSTVELRPLQGGRASDRADPG